jgi:methyl-accepting chemotaxis protein
VVAVGLPLFGFVLIPWALNGSKAGSMNSQLPVRCQQKGEVMIKRENRRRSLLVNKPLQYRFLAMVLVYSFIIFAFLAVTLFVPDMIQMQDEKLILEVRTAAAERVLMKHSWVWPTVIILICGLGLHSFRAFQRVFGPLYRFQCTFEQIRNGELNFQVKIRAKDYLHQEEETLNDMMEALARKLGSIRQAGEDSLKSLGELEQTVNGGNDWKETDKKLLRLHRHQLEHLVNTARYFQLPNAEHERVRSGSSD